MTEEEKKSAELAAAEEAKAKAEREANETDEEKAKREAEEEKVRLQAEHEAALKLETDRANAAQKAAADAEFKLREERRKKKEAGDSEPLTEEQLEATLEREREATRKERESEFATEKVKKLSTGDTETALILQIFNSRMFPKGMSLDERVEESFAIANRKTIIARAEELKRAKIGKDNASDDVATSHHDSIPLQEPKTSPGDVQALKAGGFVWDGKSQLYKKMLPQGRVFTYNPKTKERKVIGK